MNGNTRRKLAKMAPKAALANRCRRCGDKVDRHWDGRMVEPGTATTHRCPTAEELHLRAAREQFRREMMGGS